MPDWVSLKNENEPNTLLFVCVDAALVALAPLLSALEVGGTPVAVYTPVGREVVSLFPVVVVFVPTLVRVLEGPDDATCVAETGVGALVIILVGAVPGTPAMVSRLGSGDCQSDSCS